MKALQNNAEVEGCFLTEPWCLSAKPGRGYPCLSIQPLQLAESASFSAEAQSLASSQAGDAGAAAFSDAVYDYTAVRMCLGGRAMQAENAAAGKPLNPQPPPPPPLSGVSPTRKCSVHILLTSRVLLPLGALYSLVSEMFRCMTLVEASISCSIDGHEALRECLRCAVPAGASLPSSNTPVSLSGSGMPSAQPSLAPSMQQGTRKLLQHIPPQVGATRQ